MGWTSYHLDDTSTKGRKAELDAYCTWSEKTESGTIEEKPLKSSMIGSTYYAAIETVKNGIRRVYGIVILTQIDNNDYFNFAYKPISEDMGPVEDRCPRAILDLLTETEYKYAQEWRKRCRENLDRPTLASLPYGTRIAFTFCGTHYEARKMPPAYQFKTAWFLLDNGQYMPKTRIKHFEIISTPEARTA